MGWDSQTEGCGFKLQHRISDGHFFTLISSKIVLMFVWERLKIYEKEAGDGPFYYVDSYFLLKVLNVISTTSALDFQTESEF